MQNLVLQKLLLNFKAQFRSFPCLLNFLSNGNFYFKPIHCRSTTKTLTTLQCYYLPRNTHYSKVLHSTRAQENAWKWIVLMTKNKLKLMNKMCWNRNIGNSGYPFQFWFSILSHFCRFMFLFLELIQQIICFTLRTIHLTTENKEIKLLIYSKLNINQ